MSNWKRDRNKVEVNRRKINLFFQCIMILSIAIVSCPYVTHHATLQKILWIGIAFAGIVIYKYKCNYYTDETYLKTMLLFSLPYIFAMVYTLFLGLIRDDNIGFMMQSITTPIFIVVDALMVWGLICIYKDKILNVISCSLIFAFGVSIVVRIYKYGSENLRANLELHDVGVAVVPILIVYLFELLIDNNIKLIKDDIIQIVLLLVVLFICAKRSAFFSIFAAASMIIIYKLFKNSIKILMTVFCILSMLMCYLYVFLIRSGLIDFLSQGYGTLSDRYYVWNWFKDSYDFSPLYLGQGFQYIHKYMEYGNGDGMVNSYGYLHNSILQIFIETGFWGFTLWFGTILWFIPHYVKNKMGKKLYEYIVISNIAMVVMYMVDNTLTYPLYIVSYFISIYCVYSMSKPKN